MCRTTTTKKVAMRKAPRKKQARVCWPKTDIPKTKEPEGPRSISASFEWAEVFLSRLEQKLGRGLVRKRLESWNWDVVSAFSGVGCAETVTCLSWLKFIEFVVAIHLRVSVLQPQALLTIQKAAGPRRGARLRWAVESDPNAQKVLLGTYGSCLSHDIFDFDMTAETNQCLRHKTACPTLPSQRGSGYLAT